MGRMVRKQAYIKLEHEELLKRRSREWGVTEAELIRRGIEHVCRPPAPLVSDEAAWQDALAFIYERRARLPALGGQRTWTREEIYAERPKYLSR